VSQAHECVRVCGSPTTLSVREVCLRLTRRGFRDQTIIVVTTLLDAKRYSARQLTELYGLRWQAAEVNLRHLKTTLKWRC